MWWLLAVTGDNRKTWPVGVLTEMAFMYAALNARPITRAWRAKRSNDVSWIVPKLVGGFCYVKFEHDQQSAGRPSVTALALLQQSASIFVEICRLWSFLHGIHHPVSVELVDCSSPGVQGPRTAEKVL